MTVVEHKERRKSVEQRVYRLIDIVRDRISKNDETTISRRNGSTWDTGYFLTRYPSKLEVISTEVWTNSLQIERRFWSGQMMETTIIRLINNGNYKFHDNKNNLKLEGEEALTKVEERIEEFLPQPQIPQEA